MQTHEAQALHTSHAYISFSVFVDSKRTNCHFNDLIKSAINWFWETFFPLFKDGNLKYELRSSDKKWAANHSVVKLFANAGIFLKSGRTITLLPRGEKFLLGYIEEEKEMIHYKHKIEDLEIEAAKKDLEIEALEEAKDEVIMWYDERFEKIEQTNMEMKEMLAEALAQLTPEQKEKVPHLRLVTFDDK